MQTIPLCVAHPGNGEISSCNYVARAQGVKAMYNTTTARQELCPDLVSFPFEFSRYVDVAKKMYRCLYQQCPYFQALSIDELVLDVTHLVLPHLPVDAQLQELGDRFRRIVEKETEGCTVGKLCVWTV